MDSWPLKALRIGSYRSFGVKGQTFESLGQVNIIVGPNNAGKSNILRFLCEEPPFSSEIVSDRTRLHDGAEQPYCHFGIDRKELLRRALQKLDSPEQIRSTLEGFVENISDGTTIWYSVQITSSRAAQIKLENVVLPDLISSYSQNRDLRDSIYRVWSSILKSTGGSIEAHWIPQLIDKLMSLVDVKFPKPHLIPAVRYIDKGGEKFSNYGGAALIKNLSEIQSPDHYERERLKDFESINAFLRSVVESSEARLEIPHNLSHVLVHLDGKVLPLASLGTGIHQVIMIAAACVLNDGGIVCIEEPEQHLHPRLQRLLIGYLSKNTTSQYFITTHSASLIDVVDGNVFHVSNDKSESKIRLLLSERDKSDLVELLGYRASDILQSNYVIWVEGPSDRILLRWWISSFDNDLIEGIHYTIMFYGGRLLSHLSFNSDEVDAFIKLQRLGRNSCVIIDSDRTSESSTINATKERIRKESEASGSLCWVTAGREIENYLGKSVVHSAISDHYGKSFERFGKWGAFSNVLQFYRKDRNGETVLEKSPDKVGLASRFSKGDPDFSILDLEERVRLLTSDIRRANDL